MIIKCLVCSKYLYLESFNDSFFEKGFKFLYEQAMEVFFIFGGQDGPDSIKKAWLFVCKKDCNWIEDNGAAASALLKSKIELLEKRNEF